MANRFPTALNNYTGDETLAAAEHAQAHNALETKVGVGNSTVVSSLDYRVNALEQHLFNVKKYGAVGDDSTDDRIAIQAAITAAHNQGGGIVYFPGAIYKVAGTLTMYSSIKLVGVAMESSLIHFTAATVDGITGSGLSSCGFEDIGLIGNGTGSTPGSNGCGINFSYGAAGNNPFHHFKNVMVKNFGSDGIRIQTPIVCSFQKVYVAYNGLHGFNWYEGGTSCNFQACWSRQNSAAGYRFNTSVYQSLTGCAADNNGINYLLTSTQGIGFFACGSEGALRNDATYNGYGWKIDNSSVIDLRACWVTDNRNLGVWVTNGSQVVGIQAADNTPNATAVNFIKVDAACTATISDLHNTTANSLAVDTTLTLNDGGAPAVASSGHLALKAGTSKLVKTTVLRQDNVTNTYQNGNTVILTGNGFASAAAAQVTETVPFGVTFLQRPIVIATWGGDSSGASTYGSGGNNVKGLATCKAETITTTGFDIRIRTTDGTAWAGTDVVFYQWIAIGEIA
jgi:hypothetical protein